MICTCKCIHKRFQGAHMSKNTAQSSPLMRASTHVDTCIALLLNLRVLVMRLPVSACSASGVSSCCPVTCQ
jgi:hypothetical protein